MKNKIKKSELDPCTSCPRAQWEFELIMEVNSYEEPMNGAVVGLAILEAVTKG
jgi:hypothetical protein